MCEKKWHVAMSGVLPQLYLDHILYRNITAAFLFFVVVLSTSGQTSVLTQHNDNARSGQNTSETILNTSDVNLNQFGKLFAMPSDGQVYAQPLYVPGVTINGAVHNVVIHRHRKRQRLRLRCRLQWRPSVESQHGGRGARRWRSGLRLRSIVRPRPAVPIRSRKSGLPAHR